MIFDAHPAQEILEQILRYGVLVLVQPNLWRVPRDNFALGARKREGDKPSSRYIKPLFVRKLYKIQIYPEIRVVKVRDQLLIDGLHFHDSRAEALTRLSRKVDVMTLAKISGHKDLSVLQNTYYRESAEQIAARL